MLIVAVVVVAHKKESCILLKLDTVSLVSGFSGHCCLGEITAEVLMTSLQLSWRRRRFG
jgi:hypothetical protein